MGGALDAVLAQDLMKKKTSERPACTLNLLAQLILR